MPGVLYGRGVRMESVLSFLSLSGQGIYGIPIGVASTYIILFTIFGAFLSEFGAGGFFFKFSNALTRGMTAASAKTAVIFSTLLGMISGSAAGNVAVTGSFTIPVMKREGYLPHQAGAIEAVVSTGGQIMPPVMGAAAFIMAEIVGTPYVNIMKAGLLPALLFFRLDPGGGSPAGPEERYPLRQRCVQRARTGVQNVCVRSAVRGSLHLSCGNDDRRLFAG